MKTTDQKVIEYLLGRIQELEQENKIHNDFIKSITLSTKPIISEELIEKFKNEWNRTPPMVFKKKVKIIETNLHPDYIQLTSEQKIEKGDFVEGDINFMELMIGQKVGNRKVWRLNHLIYRDLSKEEIIQKDDIVFNEDHNRYIEAYLLDGEEVRDRKVKRKIDQTQQPEFGVFKERLEKGLVIPEAVEEYIRSWIKDGETGMYTFLGFSTYDAEQYTKHGLKYLKKLHNSNKEESHKHTYDKEKTAQQNLKDNM